jgi:hypothetical protein
MFSKTKQIETPGLEESIELAITELKLHDPNSDEYKDIVTQIERLDKLRRIPKQDARKPVSGDALVAVAGNLAGIVAILSYERLHVVTSKALGLIIKSKL